MKKNVKNKKVMIALVVVSAIVLLALVMTIIYFIGKKPLKELIPANVKAIVMQTAPPYLETELSDQSQITSIVALMNEVVVYKEAKKIEGSEKRIIFTLDMQDGSKKKIAVFTPYFEIDGVTYKAEFDSCSTLVTEAKEYLYAE